jgi:hypothetical protein
MRTIATDTERELVALTSPLDDDPEVFHTRECHSLWNAGKLYTVNQTETGGLRECKHCQKLRKPELNDGYVWVTNVATDCYHTSRCVAVQKTDPKQVPKETIPHRRQCKFCAEELDTENKSKYAERPSEGLAEMNAAEVFDG